MIRYCVLLGCMALLTACTFPQKAPYDMPDARVIGMVQDESGQWHALPPDCDALLSPSRLDRWGDSRPAIAFGCATYTNLAHQLARPDDLIDPRPYAGQSARTAGSAAQRYYDNAVTPLKETSTRSTARTLGGN